MMIKEAQKTLLALLRSALWGCTYNGPSKIEDWTTVFTLAQQQTVIGLLSDAMLFLPQEIRPKQIIKYKIIPKVAYIQQSHSLLNKKVTEVKRMMDDHHILCVLLKGQGVALNYSNPFSRQCGDIDLYVGNKHFQKAMDLLEPSVKHNAKKYAHLKHYNVVSDRAIIEIHRIAEILPGFREDRMFQQWTEEMLQEGELRKVEIDNVEVNLPPVDFDVIYIMNHAWQHFMLGGIGLRQLCDWAIFLHKFHQEIDRQSLEKNLVRFDLMRAWQMFGSVAVKALGLPAHECSLYTGKYDDKVEKILEVIWSEGNFGMHSKHHKAHRPKGHFAGKLHSFQQYTCRIFRIMSISPKDVWKSWFYNSMNGISNIFIKRL